jgi:hypothetical protein
VHRQHLQQILRDVDIASAIQPIVTRRELSYDSVFGALVALDVPRASHIAALVASPASNKP